MKCFKNYIAGIAVALMAISASAQTEVNRYGEDLSSDMALVYAGSDRRPEWTVDEIMPYVVHTYADGTKDWLFDSFLYLEFTKGSTGEGFDNGVGVNGKFANKADWEWLLNRHIKQLASLDSAITIAKAELGEPRLRHKVVLGMPAPIKAQGKNFGEINGKTMDFSTEADRLTAAKWYVSELVKRFNAAEYENFDLNGIYWLEESLFTNGGIIADVNDWIYRNQLRSYWIPYYKDNAEFRFNWRDKYGFDVAYQQPNYFFDREVPMSQLEAACDESKKYGLAMEMEFETQGKSCAQHDAPDSYYDRLVDYLDVFERKGVFDESAVAWYSGTKGFLDLARSKDAKNHEIADRMARIIAKRQQRKADSFKYPVNQVRDLALIYQGATYRIPWTEDQFVPYVTHTFADGTKDWIYDGFLFLDASNGDKVKYFPWMDDEGATKADWQWYIDRLFEPGKSLDALNKCIATQKKELGDPGFKHKIVLTQLIPIKNNKHWGELDGRKLDFSNVEDQVAACQWYIDQLIERFNAGGYDNLELIGIYWLDEDMIHTDGFAARIAPYIHSKGLEFSWIPYFKGRGYDKWRDYGFDIVYMQPNHFFNKNLPDKRLDEACDVALRNGIAMEYESDANALSQKEDSSIDRMHAYIDAFERWGVWDTSAIAHYTGSKLLIDFVENPSPENQAAADRYCRHIIDRRSKPGLIPAK